MKPIRRKKVSITKSRWLTYAAAGAATAVAGANVAEGEIHYSGPLNLKFNPPIGGAVNVHLPLDQPGDSLNPSVSRWSSSTTGGDARFRLAGIGGASIAGRVGSRCGACGSRNYAAKLSLGTNLSDRNFVPTDNYNQIAYLVGYFNSQWRGHGTAFIGFRFNDGAGWRYGWARIQKDDPPRNFFKLVDYAYADVGEPIKAGQKRTHEETPVEGSLGWLAAGAVGLLAWRRMRSPGSAAEP